jgi:hypothetical protein
MQNKWVHVQHKNETNSYITLDNTLTSSRSKRGGGEMINEGVLHNKVTIQWTFLAIQYGGRFTDSTFLTLITFKFL